LGEGDFKSKTLNKQPFFKKKINKGRHNASLGKNEIKVLQAFGKQTHKESGS
jgi:hypothetical protein